MASQQRDNALLVRDRTSVAWVWMDGIVIRVLAREKLKEGGGGKLTEYICFQNTLLCMFG